MSFKEVVLKHRVKSGALFASLLLLGFGAYRHFDLPDMIAEQERVTKEATQSHSNVVNSSSLTEHLEALRAANKAVAARVAKASDLAGNTQYFYNLENELGLREIGLSPTNAKAPKKPVAGAFYQTVTFTSVVEGRYSQILTFIDKLEGSAWFGRIASLNLRHTANADTRGDPLLNATLTVELLATP